MNKANFLLVKKVLFMSQFSLVEKQNHDQSNALWKISYIRNLKFVILSDEPITYYLKGTIVNYLKDRHAKILLFHGWGPLQEN